MEEKEEKVIAAQLDLITQQQESLMILMEYIGEIHSQLVTMGEDLFKSRKDEWWRPVAKKVAKKKAAKRKSTKKKGAKKKAAKKKPPRSERLKVIQK